MVISSSVLLIDAMRQVLFIRPTSTYFAGGAPGGPFPLQPKKKTDRLHKTAVGATFSYAKTTVHYSKDLAPHKCQSEKQADAVTKQKRGT